jgi:hypothetical protein
VGLLAGERRDDVDKGRQRLVDVLRLLQARPNLQENQQLGQMDG